MESVDGPDTSARTALRAGSEEAARPGQSSHPPSVNVLVLGGWSPGPLDFLEEECSPRCAFHAPPLHMPPAGLRWCLNPFLPALLVLLGALLPWAWAALARLRVPAYAVALLRVALLVAALVGARCCIAWLVRYSIHACLHVAQTAIRDHEVDVVVGFSWGGGIGCWLLARGGWSGPTLLLAPTVEKMRRAGWMPAPAFTAAPRLVHIFHAAGDPFTPQDQIGPLARSGAEMHLCENDAHVFFQHRSLERIAAAFEELCSRVRADA